MDCRPLPRRSGLVGQDKWRVEIDQRSRHSHQPLATARYPAAGHPRRAILPGSHARAGAVRFQAQPRQGPRPKGGRHAERPPARLCRRRGLPAQPSLSRRPPPGRPRRFADAVVPARRRRRALRAARRDHAGGGVLRLAENRRRFRSGQPGSGLRRIRPPRAGRPPAVHAGRPGAIGHGRIAGRAGRPACRRHARPAAVPARRHPYRLLPRCARGGRHARRRRAARKPGLQDNCRPGHPHVADAGNHRPAGHPLRAQQRRGGGGRPLPAWRRQSGQGGGRDVRLPGGHRRRCQGLLLRPSARPGGCRRIGRRPRVPARPRGGRVCIVQTGHEIPRPRAKRPAHPGGHTGGGGHSGQRR